MNGGRVINRYRPVNSVPRTQPVRPVRSPVRSPWSTPQVPRFSNDPISILKQPAFPNFRVPSIQPVPSGSGMSPSFGAMSPSFGATAPAGRNNPFFPPRPGGQEASF